MHVQQSDAVLQSLFAGGPLRHREVNIGHVLHGKEIHVVVLASSGFVEKGEALVLGLMSQFLTLMLHQLIYFIRKLSKPHRQIQEIRYSSHIKAIILKLLSLNFPQSFFHRLTTGLISLDHFLVILEAFGCVEGDVFVV